MNKPQPLAPIDQRVIDFYGDEVLGVLIEQAGERRIYVPIRPICRYLGLDWSGQRQRIMRDDVLADETRLVVVTPTNPQGGDPETLALPLDLLPGWLFGVSSARVKPELKARITLYKRECYRRLWDAFKHEILPSARSEPALPQSGAHLAYELATAVQNLAREQMDLEQRLDGRIDRMAQWAKGVAARMNDLEGRVNGLELHVGPTALISEQQAAEIALAVKNVGRALSEQGVKPGYSQVYGELYRRYGISSYKNVPQANYADVLAWLKQWHSELEPS